MKPVALALLFATLTLSAPAQAPQSLNSLAPILSFEAPQPVDMPRGWGGGPAGTIFVDNKIVHGGQWSARLELDAASSDGASRLIAYIPADFAGSRIEWRGYLKTQDVSGFAGLWLREDGDAPSLAFDNMERLRLNGTHDWAEYSINLPFHPAKSGSTICNSSLTANRCGMRPRSNGRKHRSIRITSSMRARASRSRI